MQSISIIKKTFIVADKIYHSDLLLYWQHDLKWKKIKKSKRFGRKLFDCKRNNDEKHNIRYFLNNGKDQKNVCFYTRKKLIMIVSLIFQKASEIFLKLWDDTMTIISWALEPELHHPLISWIKRNCMFLLICRSREQLIET